MDTQFTSRIHRHKLAALVWMLPVITAMTLSESPADGGSQGWLGVAAEPASSGLRIRHVVPTSPADVAGLREDDLMLSIAGQRTADRDSFTEALRQQGAGSAVRLEALRTNSTLNLQAVLQSVPDESTVFQKELVNRRVPSPSTLTTSNGAIDLTKLGGSVAVIELFSAYCKPCRELASHSQELYEKWGSRGLKVVAIADDDLPTATAWATKHNLSYTIASDTAKNSLDTFHATSLPATIVIDSQGVVRATWLGYSSNQSDQIEATIKPLLSK